MHQLIYFYDSQPVSENDCLILGRRGCERKRQVINITYKLDINKCHHEAYKYNIDKQDIKHINKT